MEECGQGSQKSAPSGKDVALFRTTNIRPGSYQPAGQQVPAVLRVMDTWC